jgi:arginyl-tRNA synthetase
MDKLQEKGLLVEQKGAILADLEKYKLGKVVVKKAGESTFMRLLVSNSTTPSVTDTVSSNHFTDGTSIYITRDLGGAKERYDKYKFDKMIYVVASQQDLHCKQFFKMLELMGYEWADRLQHINFGESTDL